MIPPYFKSEFGMQFLQKEVSKLWKMGQVRLVQGNLSVKELSHQKLDMTYGDLTIDLQNGLEHLKEL